MKKSSVVSLLASAALIGFCGCASEQTPSAQEPAKPARDTRGREEKLQVGMTMEEVRLAIGNPQDLSANSDGSQTWTYNEPEKTFNPNYTVFSAKFHSTIVNFDTSGKVKSWSPNASGRY